MNNGNLVAVEALPREGEYSQEQIMELLRRLARSPGSVERLLRCADQIPEFQRVMGSFEDRCRTTMNRCDAIEMLCRNFLCPGNVNFSQRTLDEYSGLSQVKLAEIVTDLGDPYVNNFPVPPGKKIRLTHRPRPGYTPINIRLDLNIAGGGNNYSDFSVQFFLVPGGVDSALGLSIGNNHDGNIFLNKDGTQISVPFPEYRGTPHNVGSLELLAVELRNGGAGNNLDSAHVNVFYDNTRFYENCKAQCSGGCASPTTPSM